MGSEGEDLRGGFRITMEGAGREGRRGGSGVALRRGEAAEGRARTGRGVTKAGGDMVGCGGDRGLTVVGIGRMD